MGIVIIIILVVLGFFIFINKNAYKSIGKTVGLCVEVKTELTDSYYNDSTDNAVSGSDRRMYRPYIKYEWQGKEYIAKSFSAYSQANIFPKDEVEIEVNDENKEIVKIIRRISKENKV